MNFQDHWATDSEGNTFIFTVEMQRKLQEAGLPVEPDNVSELGEQPGRTAAPERERPAEQREEEEMGPETIKIDPRTGKYLGQLKWFNPVRGYGFIARGGGEDIFFHKTSVIGDPATLDEGTWVLYDVEERRKGLEAAEVEIYEE